MRALFYSPFIFRNGQNAIPPSAPRGRMNRMFRMKIQDGERWDKRCRFRRAPTGPQWNIASYFFLPKVRSVFQWYFLQEKGKFANDCRGHDKNDFSPSATNCEREQVEALYFFVPRVAVIFVTQCLLWQDRASRRAFSFYARNPNYSEHSVSTILIPEIWIKKRALGLDGPRPCTSLVFHSYTLTNELCNRNVSTG